jgi:S-adenosylmethionine:tRNA ribosyltransferase-isomerase
MKLSDFDYKFPKDNIAVYPPEVRGNSRLMVLNRETGAIEHRKYFDIFEYLDDGDVLVLNNTKVIKARLIAEKEGGGKAELIVLEKHKDFKQEVLYRTPLKIGEKLIVNSEELIVKDLKEGGIAVIESEKDLIELAEKHGEMPIPPYMKRKSEKSDEERYQTIFARVQGSVAAPTASLNFTDELKSKLESKGVKICYLTLHVGLGTFLPIRTDNIEDHNMHKEYFYIPSETIGEIRRAKESGKAVAALGTTVTRTLEFSADQILNSINFTHHVKSPLSNVINELHYKNKSSRSLATTQDDNGGLEGEADIFIYPGYNFKVVDKLITNFHAPKSTVLMLAAAFAGWDKLKSAYEIAVSEDYKLLSYGDSMLII